MRLRGFARDVLSQSVTASFCSTAPSRHGAESMSQGRALVALLVRKRRFRKDCSVKSFFELLGKAMQSTSMTLRLCLLMVVAGAAFFLSQVK